MGIANIEPSHRIPCSTEKRERPKTNGLLRILKSALEAIKNFFSKLFSYSHQSRSAVSQRNQLVEQIEALLDEPNIPNNRGWANFVKENFELKMRDVLSGLLKGKVTLLKDGVAKTFSGKISKPQDLKDIFIFVENRLNLFNRNRLYRNRRVSADEGIREVDIEAFFKDFEELRNLIPCWEKMKGVSRLKDLQQKIDSLSEIATSLPPKENEVWDQYPTVRIAMGSAYMEFFNSVFETKYIFEMTPDRNSLKCEEDQIKQTQLISALTTIAEKLQCSPPSEAVYFEPDTSKDHLLAQALQKFNS